MRLSVCTYYFPSIFQIKSNEEKDAIYVFDIFPKIRL